MTEIYLLSNYFNLEHYKEGTPVEPTSTILKRLYLE